MAGAVGYGSDINVKHGEIEDAFMNFASATASRGTAFTNITMTNGNLSTQLRQQEDKIWALQAELCNLKVAAEMKNVEGKTNKTAPPYVQYKKQKQ